MRRRVRTFDIFNLSFLDIISCGFGAVVLLVLLSRNADAPSSNEDNIVEQLLAQVLAAEVVVEMLGERLVQEEDKQESKSVLLDRLRSSAKELSESLAESHQDAEQLSKNLKGLSLVQESLQRASISASTAEIRDEEVGGIPVDSDYVVFIVDTSGSMKTMWDTVASQIENLIRIHPKVNGFQILNDNGSHLISGYAGRWIPDTESRRKSAIKLLHTWNSASNSSPVEGLEVALRRYAKPNIKVSIYIFGDDYSGSSYDPFIETIVRLNSRRSGGQQLARIHAVGFLTDPTRSQFATLMREVTRRNNGTFLALPR